MGRNGAELAPGEFFGQNFLVSCEPIEVLLLVGKDGLMKSLELDRPEATDRVIEIAVPFDERCARAAELFGDSNEAPACGSELKEFSLGFC